MNKIQQIYKLLLKEHGKQGWWPIINNKTLLCEYGTHAPKNRNEVFEICIGAILTQNTAWSNVEKALINLKSLMAINPEALLDLNEEILKTAIKPAGYFNQKAKKLIEFTEFFIKLKKTPSREELLNIWGVGPETADSMLLYAFKVPTFVVDAYTKRILLNLKLIDKDATYEEIKELFESNLKKELIVYQEYHALLVEHAKRYYSKKSEYCLCPLYKMNRKLNKSI